MAQFPMAQFPMAQFPMAQFPMAQFPMAQFPKGPSAPIVWEPCSDLALGSFLLAVVNLE
jgi:hypothetical protein